MMLELKEMVSPELIDKVEEILKKNKKYMALLRNAEVSKKQRNYIIAMQIEKQLDKIRHNVAEQVINQKIEEKLEYKNILAALPDDVAKQYVYLNNALLFCYDAIETYIQDINDILAEHLPGASHRLPAQFAEAKKLVTNCLNGEMNVMDDIQRTLISAESRNVTQIILDRAGVYERKNVKLHKKSSNNSENTNQTDF